MNHKIISKITSGALLCTMVAYTSPVLAFTKEETVYAKLESNGKNYHTIVNNHLNNEEQENMINDLSDLINIENVNGEETFEQEGNQLIWKAEGKDIYYQGESQKKLPIQCQVTYELEGKEITPEELAGKSGKVKITIKYVNQDAHQVSIQGKEETLYTPFVVVCGTILNNENHKNIEITNGKAIDDGKKTTVIGMSLPGLQASLQIEKSKLEIPDTIEITMDVTDFESNPIITFVTPKIIEDTDLELFDQLGEIYDKVNTLESASAKIEEGANTLQEGTDTYSEKSKEFNSAIHKIAEGTSLVNSNYHKVNDGIHSLTKGSKTLQAGVEAFNSGVQEATTKLTALPGVVQQLYTGSNSLKAGIEQVSAGVKGTNGLEANLNTVIENLIKTNEALKVADPSNPQIVVNEAIISQMQSLGAKQKLQQLNTGLDGIASGAEDLSNGLDLLNQSTQALPDSLGSLMQGAGNVLVGTEQLAKGANDLEDGSGALKKGIQNLDDNMQKLTNANDQLTDGSNTIKEGATTLAEGIQTFNQEGIQTICDYVNGDIQDITVRLEKLQELSKEYQHFTMANEKEQGNVKFIMIMDGIKQEEKSKQEVIFEEKEQETKEE